MAGHSQTITVTLTEPQFRAIALAVDLSHETLQESGMPTRALDNAWRRLHHAWYAREAPRWKR